ncbi:MAG TPA: DinB family protein [Terracidiphilus sp.]|nr:DinB family protein [Terracidiphilus sp.]
MFTLDGMRKLHGWTHASLDLVLDHLDTLPAEDFGKAVPGFGFPTLREQVIHICNCEGFWVHLLEGKPYVAHKAAECATVADARLVQQAVIWRTRAYLARLTKEQLNSNQELRFPEGDTAVRTPALILHHMLTHAFHHKGQIVAMCRLLGHPAPDTDLNQFE